MTENENLELEIYREEKIQEIAPFVGVAAVAYAAYRFNVPAHVFDGFVNLWGRFEVISWK